MTRSAGDIFTNALHLLFFLVFTVNELYVRQKQHFDDVAMCSGNMETHENSQEVYTKTKTTIDSSHVCLHQLVSVL